MLGKGSIISLKRHKSSSICELSINAFLPVWFIFSASQLSHSFPHLLECTCKTALTSPANSPLFEEALILVSPRLGRQTVPASILLSPGLTQISMPVNTLSHMHVYMGISMQVALPVAQKSLWVALFQCLKTQKMVFVLLRKWCCASWGAVSFSRVVLVWPLKGSPQQLRGSKWIIGAVGVKHLFLISGIMYHRRNFKKRGPWSDKNGYFRENLKKSLRWCPVSFHSWLHFLLMCADLSPTPHSLKGCLHMVLRPAAKCPTASKGYLLPYVIWCWRSYAKACS